MSVAAATESGGEALAGLATNFDMSFGLFRYWGRPTIAGPQPRLQSAILRQ